MTGTVSPHTPHRLRLTSHVLPHTPHLIRLTSYGFTANLLRRLDPPRDILRRLEFARRRPHRLRQPALATSASVIR